MSEPCPLCLADQAYLLARAGNRDYWRCPVCRLTFLQPDQRPDRATELAEYRRHRNDPTDPGYRRFLRRLSDQLVPHLWPGALGLDYGSGPGPTLSLMLTEQGYPTAIYDPFFAPDPAPLSRRYDFITCSETVEHFHHPAREFERLDRLLNPGGWLGIMTEMQAGDERFANWWYLRDPTHVCFYHRRSMAWLGERFGWRVHHPRRTVTLFQKRQRDNVDTRLEGSGHG